MKFLFVIGFSNFFARVLLFSLFCFYFSLSLPFAPPLLVSTLFFPFSHFTLPFPPLQNYIPTTSLFEDVFPLFCCSLSSTLCSYWCIAYLLQSKLCSFFLSSSYFKFPLLGCLQALIVPINVACVGPSVNWLPN